MTNNEPTDAGLCRASSIIRASSLIRHSCFVIRHCSAPLPSPHIQLSKNAGARRSRLYPYPRDLVCARKRHRWRGGVFPTALRAVIRNFSFFRAFSERGDIFARANRVVENQRCWRPAPCREVRLRRTGINRRVRRERRDERDESDWQAGFISQIEYRISHIGASSFCQRDGFVRSCVAPRRRNKHAP